MTPGADPAEAPRLTVMVPAHNEGGILRESIEHLLRSLGEIGETFEVIIVDDGSRDDTGKVADDLAASDPRLRVVHHDRNRRLGATIRSAAAAARGEFFTASPADSPLDAAQIRAFLETLEPWSVSPYLAGRRAADVAVGVRPERPGYRLWMKVCSRIYHLLLCLLLRMWLRDFNWICMYRTAVLRTITIEFDGFIALPEILAKAKRAGFALRQVRCPMKPRKAGKGTVGRPRVLFGAFADLVRLWARLTFGRRAAAARER